MSTNLACFLFGIPTTYFWVLGLKKGIMYGRRTRWVRRDDDPLEFWFIAIFSGIIALGLWIFPVLAWLGLRD
jgi:hypothetical protein